MFYHLKKSIQEKRFSRAIRGVLDTPPVHVKDAPWRIVSIVTSEYYVLMYLLALKSFYSKVGRGNVTAIINREMPAELRDILQRHVVGIEFVVIEDIDTGACQHGGTWERLVYILDRTEHEYMVQMDCDTLFVGNDIAEVVHCLETNTPFTISDGFEILPLADVADEADATPSDYIGIVTERAFRHYPDAGKRYVRGSSGFAGFSRGGFSRPDLTRFHQDMERLVGAERWRVWGTEQCGSNFAIANSPGAVVLPFPEYASFTPYAHNYNAKFLHFIGSFRYLDGYYVARGQELIAALRHVPSPPGRRSAPTSRSGGDALPLAFTRRLTPASGLRYLAWRLGGQRGGVSLRLRSAREFPGPAFQLRPRSEGNNDYGVSYELFVDRILATPVRIPPERVKLIVDLGANVGFATLYWLAAYWRAEILAFEPHPGHAAQWRRNIECNGFLERATLQEVAVGTAPGEACISDEASSSRLSDRAKTGFAVQVVDILALLAGRRVDILKIDIEGSEYEILEDPRFADLDIRAIVMEWHDRADRPAGKAWVSERLRQLGFRLFPSVEHRGFGMIWAYRRRFAVDEVVDEAMNVQSADPRSLEAHPLPGTA